MEGLEETPLEGTAAALLGPGPSLLKMLEGCPQNLLGTAMLYCLVPDSSLQGCSSPQYVMARAVRAPTPAEQAAPLSVLQDRRPKCLCQTHFTWSSCGWDFPSSSVLPGESAV